MGIHVNKRPSLFINGNIIFQLKAFLQLFFISININFPNSLSVMRRQMYITKSLPVFQF